MHRSKFSNTSFSQANLSKDRKINFFNSQLKNLKPRVQPIIHTEMSSQIQWLLVMLIIASLPIAKTENLKEVKTNKEICPRLDNQLLSTSFLMSLETCPIAIQHKPFIEKDDSTSITRVKSKGTGCNPSVIKPPSIQTLIKKLPISFPKSQKDALRKTMSAAAVKEWEGLIKVYINRIRTLIPSALQENHLRIILDFGINIEIVTSINNKPGAESAEAMYLPASQRILFILDTDYSDKQLLQMINNEFFHALIHAVNSLHLPVVSSSDKMLSIYPFLNEKGAVDAQKFHQHQRALTVGYQRVEAIEKLLLKPAKKLNAQEKEQLNDYYKAMSFYNPHEWRMELNEENFSQLIPGKNDRYKINNLKSHENIFFHKIIQQNKYVIGFYTLSESDKPRHKLMAFVRFIKQEFNNKYYKNLPIEMKDTETASFLLELNQEVLQVFFKEWYQYFTHYVDKNLCGPEDSNEHVGGFKL